MKATFFSNFLNHHQTPFCNEMYKQLNGDFTFVSTEMIPEVYLKNGYPDCTNYIYNLNAYSDIEHHKKALQLGIESDIVIIGSAPYIYIKDRIRQNKHTFIYSERFFKKGKWQQLNLKLVTYILLKHTFFRSKNQYMLCASAYTANDTEKFYAYPDKKYKWGYFTEDESLSIEQLFKIKPTGKIEIIWIARFIDWKHPEMVVELAYELKMKKYNFHITMIGHGIMFEHIKSQIARLNISDSISLLGSIPNNVVRDYLRKSNIFIFTSDQNEGWGAVLNEAMSSGCAVVASNKIGAVPYLIKHKENGLIFKTRNKFDLLNQVESLLVDAAYRERLSIEAYNTIKLMWNPRTAASNFISLSKSLLIGKGMHFEEGPCSKANIIKH